MQVIVTEWKQGLALQLRNSRYRRIISLKNTVSGKKKKKKPEEETVSRPLFSPLLMCN